MWQRKVISPEGTREGAQPWAQGTWPPTLSNIAPCSTSYKNTQWTNPFVSFPQVFQPTGLLQACSNCAFAILFTLTFYSVSWDFLFPKGPLLAWPGAPTPTQQRRDFSPIHTWARVQRNKSSPTQTRHRIVFKKNPQAAFSPVNIRTGTSHL